MEGQTKQGQSPHQYSSQSEQWSRLVRRNTLATSSTPVSPPLIYVPQVSTTLETFPELLPQQTVAYQAQLAAYNKLICSGRASRVQSSPLPPLLSTQHIQAVPRSGSSGFERQKKLNNTKLGHGNKKSHITEQGERPLIATEQNKLNMSTNKMESQGNKASRAQQQHSTHTHQSSSVPSTPHTRARKFSTASREPSPIPATNHSPRSAYSEANTAFPVYRPLASRLGRCPYESGMTHSRRRMAYKLGSDKLEKARPGTIKAALGRDEDAKLSKDMQRLYEKLLPSSESEQRRRSFVQKLENLLNTEWPGHDIRVHVFGSSGNMLCTDESDGRQCAPLMMEPT